MSAKFRTFNTDSLLKKFIISMVVSSATTLFIGGLIFKLMIHPDIIEIQKSNQALAELNKGYSTSLTGLRDQFDSIEKSINDNKLTLQSSKIEEIKMLSNGDKVVIGKDLYKIVQVDYEVTLTNVTHKDFTANGVISSQALPVGNKVLFLSAFPEGWSKKFSGIFTTQLVSQDLKVLGTNKKAIPLLIYSSDNNEIKQWGTRLVAGVALVKQKTK